MMSRTQAKSPTTTNDSTKTVGTGARWGTHSKMIAHPADRSRIQEFYRDVLGCYVGKGPQHPGGPESTDLIRFANGLSIVVHYDDSALGDAELRKSIWLELHADDAAELVRKIEAFGISRFDYFDKDNAYFQVPGGQVFRVLCK
jgi:hypothetical protein